MDGISGIGPISGGAMPMRPQATTGVEGTPAAMPQTAPQSSAAASSAGISSSSSILSLSSTSISASVESFVATYGPVMGSNEMLGAVLLMLILEYMKSDDPQQKRDLLGVMLGLLEQQKVAGSSAGLFAYSSASVSIESTQLQMISTSDAMNAYSGGAASQQQAPATDPSAGGLSLVA